MNNAGFTQSMEQWTSCSLMHRFVKDHESMLIRSTCDMWIWSRPVTVCLPWRGINVTFLLFADDVLLFALSEMDL